MKEIIIKIPEVLYSRAINGELTDLDTMFICGAVAQSKPLQAKLEEIKAEIQTRICQFYTGKNEFNMIKNYAFEDAIKIIDNHITELKGENK